MIGGLGLLPVGVCARCGLRAIPLALASCPRCGAVHGWLQIDRAACAVFLVALYVERRDILRSMAARAQGDVMRAARVVHPFLLGERGVVHIQPTPFEVARRAHQLDYPGVPTGILYRRRW